MDIFRALLFDSYLLVAGIVMLSLLISILGDTYDRVKLTEDAELIKCRAKLIAIGHGWNGIPRKIMYCRGLDDDVTALSPSADEHAR